MRNQSKTLIRNYHFSNKKLHDQLSNDGTASKIFYLADIINKNLSLSNNKKVVKEHFFGDD